LNLDGSGANRTRDVAQELRGVHSRVRGLVEHGRIWGTRRVEQMELVTVGWILEYLIHLVELGLVVVLNKVGHRFANVLDLLIPIAKGSEFNGVGSLVDGIGAVVPVQDPGDTLMPSGVALESITRQLVETVGGKGDRDAGILWVVECCVLGSTETWPSENGSTTCRPSAWEEVGTGNNLGKGRYREKESNDEREAKHPGERSAATRLRGGSQKILQLGAGKD